MEHATSQSRPAGEREHFGWSSWHKISHVPSAAAISRATTGCVPWQCIMGRCRSSNMVAIDTQAAEQSVKAGQVQCSGKVTANNNHVKTTTLQKQLPTLNSYESEITCATKSAYSFSNQEREHEKVTEAGWDSDIQGRKTSRHRPRGALHHLLPSTLARKAQRECAPACNGGSTGDRGHYNQWG